MTIRFYGNMFFTKYNSTICVTAFFVITQILFGQINNNNMLTGFVDMHTHPRNDLAFGTELFYGKPYGKIDEALFNCNPYHGGYGLFDNPKGNVFRSKLVDEGEAQYCKNGEHNKTG